MTEQRTGLAALDIDQTLAGGIVVAHMRFYNTQLGLGMSESQILSCGKKYRKTFDVPQIIQYRAVHEDAFQQVRSQIRASEQVNSDFELIPGVLPAMGMLVQACMRLEYFTVRPMETKPVTMSWLRKMGLPNSQTVHISRDHRNKLQQIHDATSINESAILIDDSIEPLVQELAKIRGSEGRSLRQRLGLVGFGEIDHQNQTEIKEFAEAYAVRVSFLPRWDLLLLREILRNNKK